MRPRVGVLALQGDVREHARSLEAVGAQPAAVRRVEDLAGLDGLVLPGGESTTMRRLLQVFDLLAPLREQVAGGLPVYGSCAGMVLLADTVLDDRGLDDRGLSDRRDAQGVGGLDVVVRRNAFGRQVDSFEADVALLGVGDVHGVFIRAPWVEQTGARVQVLARVPAGVSDGAEGAPAAGRVVAVRQDAVLATSFHPELTGDDRVHGLFVDMVKESRG